MNEVIEYKGIKYRRYPNAKSRTARVYYSPHVADRRKGYGRLHEEIWKNAHGPIAKGCQIHHKDGDPLNNSLDNLECLTAKQHAAKHKQEFTEARRRHLDNIRPLAAKWHSSEEGLAWHSENGRRSWTRREPRTGVCDQCGEEYETLKPSDNVRFCSNRCKAAWRRASGVDDENRTCVACGATFRVNRYSKSRTCSGSCAYKSRSMRP